MVLKLPFDVAYGCCSNRFWDYVCCGSFMISVSISSDKVSDVAVVVVNALSVFS